MAQWWKNTAVYQVYPRSFRDSGGDGIGDLPGVISKLEYIKSLGVGAIWLSPFYRSPQYDGGYDVSDYFSVDPVFGTMDDFALLLRRAHGLGLRVIIDLVVNHTSSEHEWFAESRRSIGSPCRDYYIWRKGGADGSPPNNWRDLFGGGSAWEYDSRTGEYYLHLFSKEQPDLNWENPALRAKIYDMMRKWLRLGVDGFRMDVISYLAKPPGFPDAAEGASVSSLVANGAAVHGYLREMRREALSGYDTVTVGECAGANTEDAREYANLDGSELNMVFHFEVNELDGGESFKWNRDRIRPADFKAVHSRWQKELAGRAWNSLYLSNHDQPRAVSRLGDESPEYRERSAKMLATCVYLMQGTPFIYQGEELGMTNGRFTDFEQLRDIESINAYKFLTGGGASHAEAMEIISARGRDGARTPMQWNNAEEQEKRADSVLNYYRRLLKFRRETPVITHGGYMPVFEDRGDVMGYIRETRDAAIMVLGSFAKETITCVDEELRDRSAGLLLGNVDTSEYMSSGALQPYEAVVIELKNKGAPGK